MVEEDPEKLANLCEEYGRSTAKGRELTTIDRKRRRAGESTRAVLQERASGSQSVAMYEDMDVGNVVDGDHRKWRETTEKEKEKEYAWDDVNDMLLPIDFYQESEEGGNGTLEGETCQGVGEVGGLGGDLESPDQHGSV